MTERYPSCRRCGLVFEACECRGFNYKGMVVNEQEAVRTIQREHRTALTAKDAEIERLRKACRGGNAINSTAELLEFLAERLVTAHGESDNTDYIRAANERAAMLRAALAGENV